MKRPSNNAFPGILSRRQLLAAGFLGGLTLGLPAATRAQAPAPLEIIVPFGAGGGADELARFCAAQLEKSAQAGTVTLTYVTGATGNLGIARLLSAPSDGHTLAVLTGDTYASLAYLNARWDPEDVLPLAILTRQSSALFVSARAPFTDWQAFAAEARKAPRALRVAISGFGSPDYIALQQLDARGIQLAPLPIDDPQARYQALLDGQADALYEQPGDLRSHLESGRMRALLVFGAARAPELKDVPASGELGLGNGLAQFRAVVAKAGTDPQLVAALTEAFRRIAQGPEFQAFLARQWAAPDSFVSAGSARAFMHGQLDVMKQVVTGLPLHARYPLDGARPDVLPAQF